MNSIIEKFYLYKQTGFALAFVATTVIQILSPHHQNIISDFKNWRVNLMMGALNGLALSLFAGGGALLLSHWAVINHFGLLQILRVPLALQILVSVLVLDFTAYFWHKMNHRLKFLWRFHAVHHADMNFDTSTAVRFHIGELVISLFVRLVVIAAVGIPILGLLSFELIFQFFNFFEHGNIRLNSKFERILQLVFITPALHRKHHSCLPREMNSNYGTVFSFWDRLGRTFTSSSSRETFKVGLPGQSREWSLTETLKRPFLPVGFEEAEPSRSHV